MTKTLMTSNGFAVLVDDEDFERLSKRTWRGHTKQNGQVYALRSQYVGRENGKYVYKNVHMHRDVIDVPDGMDVDHINRNPLDNRKENLRACTRSQNLANRRPRSKSGLKGVTKHRNGWKAEVGVSDGKTRLVGCYATAEEAGRAYDAAAKERWGEFAYLNFPDD